MTQEQKQLLIRDLCNRVQYEPIVQVFGDWFYEPLKPYDAKLSYEMINKLKQKESNYCIKPYLRPISAMTERECDDLFKILAINEEEGEYIKINDIGILRLFCVTGKDFEDLDKALEYCDKHFIDYRGLIPKKLALEATENMYIFE